MVTLTLACLASDKTTAPEWKEYVFADDGFAITLPYAVKPHPYAYAAEATVYSVDIPETATVTLRVWHKQRDCQEALKRLKSFVSGGKEGEYSPVKDVTIDDYPGVEYQWNKSKSEAELERSYCVNGHFYEFSTLFYSSHPVPAEALRIMNSLRLLKKNPNTPPAK